jgi:hypothetical protein
MRTTACLVAGLLLNACAPETDLRQVQASVPTTESAVDPLSSPEPSLLAGKLVEPPTGTTGIATNLASLVVRFTEAVQPATATEPFVLRTAAGEALPLALGVPVPCAQVCYQMALPQELAPSSVYTLEVIPSLLQFLDGKPVPPGSAGSFTTADAADRFAPRVQGITVTASEGCLAVHLTADEAVRAEVAVSDGIQTVSLAPSEFAASLDFAQRLPSVPLGPAVEVLVRLSDRAGNAGQSQPVALTLPPALPPLVISEVLPNPAGSETTQEFVEIYNAGSEPVSLGGLVIADKTGSDLLSDAILPPAGFAVVVAEKYDPAEGSDVPPAAGAVLVPVPGRIGSDGLANAGEAVELRAATGDVISRYGGWIDTSPSAWSGKTVKRSTMQACDGAGAWSTIPTAATPGW